MNILFCSAGRRVELLKDFRKSMDEGDRIIAADLSNLAPALYVADAHYLVPRIDDPAYLDTILDICCKEKINAVTTLIDPEIELLAKNRTRFEEIGVEVLAPYTETAELCFDKFKMYQHLTTHGIPTPDTWGDYASAMAAIESGSLAFPVFVIEKVHVHRAIELQQISNPSDEIKQLLILKRDGFTGTTDLSFQLTLGEGRNRLVTDRINIDIGIQVASHQPLNNQRRVCFTQ
mgnify:CR=1 FL=1